MTITNRDKLACLIAVGDWVIFEDHGCDFRFSAGQVLYTDKHFVVVRFGGLAFDVAYTIRFVGNREQVFAMKAEIATMVEEYHRAKRAAEAKVHEIENAHKTALREFFKQKESA